MKSKVWILLSIVVLLAIIAGIMWAMRSREAPEVSEMRELTSRMFDPGLEQEERRLVGEQMRELKENIPENRRGEVFREMGQQYRQQLSEHFRQFAALPKEERNAFLDRDIEMKQGSSPGDSRRRDSRREKREKKPSTFESMSAEQLETLKRAKLDHTSAEDRAYMIEYTKALKQRMEERGITSWGRNK